MVKGLVRLTQHEANIKWKVALTWQPCGTGRRSLYQLISSNRTRTSSDSLDQRVTEIAGDDSSGSGGEPRQRFCSVQRRSVISLKMSPQQVIRVSSQQEQRLPSSPWKRFSSAEREGVPAIQGQEEPIQGGGVSSLQGSPISSRQNKRLPSS